MTSGFVPGAIVTALTHSSADVTAVTADHLRIRTEYLPCGSAVSFTNVNTPAQWDEFRNALG